MPSHETRTYLLLCSALDAKASAVAPLNLRELKRLVNGLSELGLALTDLLDPGASDALPGADELGLDPVRVQTLLSRDDSLESVLERWGDGGVWVVGREDDDYPDRLTERLGASAPPLLYGIGDRDAVWNGGLAIVGSREAEEKSLDAARRVASVCAEEGIQVISGGARGVDAASMMASLDVGGAVLGVLPGSLWKATAGLETVIDAGRLTVVSPYGPDAPFTVGNAMGRNTLIYCASEWALVAHCTSERGGTWAGATACLRKRWCPVFVVDGPGAPSGNRHLVHKGAIPLDPAEALGTGDLRTWLEEHKPMPEHGPRERSQPLPSDTPTHDTLGWPIVYGMVTTGRLICLRDTSTYTKIWPLPDLPSLSVAVSVIPCVPPLSPSTVRWCPVPRLPSRSERQLSEASSSEPSSTSNPSPTSTTCCAPE